MLLSKICTSSTLAVTLVAGGAGAASAGTSDVPPGAQLASVSAPAADTRPGTNTFGCTPGGSFQLCVGVNYSGTYIENVQIQVKLASYDGDIVYGVSGPSGFTGAGGPYAGGPGWAPQLTIPVDSVLAAGDYCGTVFTNGTMLAGICVYAPQVARRSGTTQAGSTVTSARPG